MSAFGDIDRFDSTSIKQMIPKKDLIKQQKMVKKSSSFAGSHRLRKGFSINFAANIDTLIEDYGETV